MTNIPQPIKDLGSAALSKVANKFVDFIITKYTGKSIKVFEAEGDIEADKVKSKWEILEKPFWLQAEAAKMNRQYSNFGNALLKSAKSITASENKISDDNDLFWGLLEHSKEISNEEMQDLIAKIIAGEYNAPGTYSMSTLQVLKSVGKNELEIFQKFTGCLVAGEDFYKDFFTFGEKQLSIRREKSFDYGEFIELQNLGLIQTNSISTRIPLEDSKTIINIQYAGKVIVFRAKQTDPNYTLPDRYQLTSAGRQILKHLKQNYFPEFEQWLVDFFKDKNFEVLESKNK